MNQSAYLNEQVSRHLIHERVTRASEPHINTGSRRHRFAKRLHLLADRLEA